MEMFSSIKFSCFFNFRSNLLKVDFGKFVKAINRKTKDLGLTFHNAFFIIFFSIWLWAQILFYTLETDYSETSLVGPP